MTAPERRSKPNAAASAAAAEPTGPLVLGRSPTLIGILCVVGASVAFSANDMTVKWLSGDYPLHQIVLVRAIVAMILTLAIIIPLEGGFVNLKTRRPFIHFLRGLAVVVANMTFFVGLVSLPLGEATAIFFMAPLFITAFSVVFLGETVGLRRWIAVLVGLCGVIIVLRPGASFQWAALLPMVAALAYALLQIMTRKIGVTDKASTMAFYIQMTFIIVCTVIGLTLGDGRYAGTGNANIEFLTKAWVWPPARDIGIMAALGVFSAAGGYLISQGYRLCEAALVAPFEYLTMPLAVFWGVMIWNDWPDAVAWIGISLIAGAGLYVFYRETIMGRRNVLKAPLARNR